MRFGSRDPSECLFRIESLLKCTTSSPGRFFLALELGHPTSKAREKRPGDEAVHLLSGCEML